MRVNIAYACVCVRISVCVRHTGMYTTSKPTLLLVGVAALPALPHPSSQDHHTEGTSLHKQKIIEDS